MALEADPRDTPHIRGTGACETPIGRRGYAPALRRPRCCESTPQIETPCATNRQRISTCVAMNMNHREFCSVPLHTFSPSLDLYLFCFVFSCSARHRWA